MYPQLPKALAPLAAASLFAYLPYAAAQPIVNEDFSDPIDLIGWTATGDSVREPTGEFAQLETDGADFQRTLEQGFTIPATSSALSFDFAFSTELTLGPAGFPDAFAVSLLTGGEYLDILVVDFDKARPDPSGGLAVSRDPAIGIGGFVPFATGTSYSGRVYLSLPAWVPGQDATLYFDLFDQDDGAATIAAVDNIRLTTTAAPEPATLALMLLGLLAAGSAARPVGLRDSRRLLGLVVRLRLFDRADRRPHRFPGLLCRLPPRRHGSPGSSGRPVAWMKRSGIQGPFRRDRRRPAR